MERETIGSIIEQGLLMLKKQQEVSFAYRQKLYRSLNRPQCVLLARLAVATMIPRWRQMRNKYNAIVNVRSSTGERTEIMFPEICLVVANLYSADHIARKDIVLLWRMVDRSMLTERSIWSIYLEDTKIVLPDDVGPRLDVLPHSPILDRLHSLKPIGRPVSGTCSSECIASMLLLTFLEDALDDERAEEREDPAYTAARSYCANIEGTHVSYDSETWKVFWQWWLTELVPYVVANR